MWSLFFYTSHSVRVALLSAFFDKTIGYKHFHEIKYFQDSCIQLSECTVIDFSSSLVWCRFKNKAALSIHYSFQVRFQEVEFHSEILDLSC